MLHCLNEVGDWRRWVVFGEMGILANIDRGMCPLNRYAQVSGDRLKCRCGYRV